MSRDQFPSVNPTKDDRVNMAQPPSAQTGQLGGFVTEKFPGQAPASHQDHNMPFDAGDPMELS